VRSNHPSNTLGRRLASLKEAIESLAASTRLRDVACVVAVLACGLLALIQRYDAFGPVSLWLDDLWVAVLVESASLQELREVRPPVPFGFVALLKVTSWLLGKGAWQLQLLPAIFALALIPLLSHLAYLVTRSRSVAIVAAALVALDPLLATYSLRAKPFAGDALATGLLVLLAVRATRDKHLRRYIILCVAGVATCLVSSTSLLSSLLAVSCCGAWLLARSRQLGLSRRYLSISAAGFLAVAGTVYFTLVAPQKGASIERFWSGRFLPTDDLSAAWAFLTGPALQHFTGAFPEQMGWLALFVLPGIVWLLHSERWLGAFCLLFYLLAVLASGLRLYPLGGGRVDLYAHPVTILCAVAGAYAMFRAVPMRYVAGAVLVAAFWLAADTRYVDVADKQAVAELNREVRADDGIVIYPHANWAAGYYGKWPVKLVKVSDSTNGFYVHLERPRALTLHETEGGVEFRRSPKVLARRLGPFLNRRHRRVLYLGAHLNSGADRWIRGFFQSNGYNAKKQFRQGSSCFVVFEQK
jgi:hypothetical protein